MFGFKRRNLGVGLFNQHGRPIDLPLTDAAAFEQAEGKILRLPLQLRRRSRHFSLQAETAGAGISPRRFRSHGDPRRVQLRAGGTDIRARRFDRSADTSEKIDLIGSIEPGGIIVRRISRTAAIGCRARTRRTRAGACKR